MHHAIDLFIGQLAAAGVGAFLRFLAPGIKIRYRLAATPADIEKLLHILWRNHERCRPPMARVANRSLCAVSIQCPKRFCASADVI